jgi:hypothetical protein
MAEWSYHEDGRVGSGNVSGVRRARWKPLHHHLPLKGEKCAGILRVANRLGRKRASCIDGCLGMRRGGHGGREGLDLGEDGRLAVQERWERWGMCAALTARSYATPKTLSPPEIVTSTQTTKNRHIAEHKKGTRKFQYGTQTAHQKVTIGMNHRLPYVSACR